MAEEKDKNVALFADEISEKITVSDYISNLSKKVEKVSPLTEDEFFKITNKQVLLRNIDLIWSFYDSQEKEDYKSDYSSGKLPYIKEGTTVFIPTTKVEFDFQKLTREGQFLSQGDFKSFWSEKYKTLISSINYQPDYTEIDEESGLELELKTIPQHIRVWIYLKAIDKIIDISPFVISCSTAKSNLSGSFNINLVPFKKYSEVGVFGENYYDSFNITTKEGYAVKSFLEKYVQSNDIIFLRFEKLKNEILKVGEDLEFEVSPNKLAKSDDNFNIWDMIGFVDTCTVSTSFAANESSVNISGRDFCKLFLEDGSYFMPLVWVAGSADRWMFGGNEKDDWYQRNVITGNYDYFFHYGFRPIKDTIWFIVNVLSNIGIVKNSLFSSYGTKRTEAYKIEDNGKSGEQKVNGVWQILQVFVDDILEPRNVVDPSFANPDGTLMSFVQKICQEPFVEVIMDTYIDTLDIVVRQPPFTEKAIMDVLSSEELIVISKGSVLEMSLTYDERAYSWYQIFPQNNFTGANEFTSLAFIPIIYFDEYVKIWGNKRQQIQDIYISASSLGGSGGGSGLNSMAAALTNDLLFLVETCTYLPFTRRGIIVMNGDRRIKVGTFVKNEVSDELFYVTSVSHDLIFSNGAVERRTIINVERGMYIPILEGKKDITKKDNTESGSPETASYFKIVDIQRMKNDIVKKAEAAKEDPEKNKIGGGESVINKTQLDFFLQKQYFGDIDKNI